MRFGQQVFGGLAVGAAVGSRRSRVRFSVRTRFIFYELCFFLQSFSLEFSLGVGVLGLGF